MVVPVEVEVEVEVSVYKQSLKAMRSRLLSTQMPMTGTHKVEAGQLGM